MIRQITDKRFSQMNDQIIEFVSTDVGLTDKFEPLPAKKLVPQWFKNISPGPELTVKECMPALDYLTSGYIIQNTWHVSLKQNVPIKYFPNSRKEKYIEWQCAADQWAGTNAYINMHTYNQCPMNMNDSPTDYFKIMNPWLIKTPPGYSCLVIPPLYHNQKGYTMLPAIVDTDTYDAPINLSGYLTDYKNAVNIMPGDPLVQIIPFKRDSWKMSISEIKQHRSKVGLYLKGVTKIYKNLFHSRKKFN